MADPDCFACGEPNILAPLKKNQSKIWTCLNCGVVTGIGPDAKEAFDVEVDAGRAIRITAPLGKEAIQLLPVRG